MTQTIPPHGGELIDLLLSGTEAERARDDAASYPKVDLGPRETADFEMLATGALSPLTGFMTEKDYRSVLDGMRLASGLAWSIPITVPLQEEDVKRIGGSDALTLTIRGEPAGILEVEQVFSRDRAIEAEAVFQTTDASHPGVAALDAAGDWVVGGRVRAFRLPEHSRFLEHRRTPAETRSA
ncbi:MAG: sulfate adenylyltransferase, partial [Actinomycetota bacterium]|nr:sulfate adenylyltransferase [Actinomycetota bacterium]